MVFLLWKYFSTLSEQKNGLQRNRGTLAIFFLLGLIANRLDSRVNRNININKLHFGLDIFFCVFFALCYYLASHKFNATFAFYLCRAQKFGRRNKLPQLEFVWPLCLAEMPKIWFFLCGGPTIDLAIVKALYCIHHFR